MKRLENVVQPYAWGSKDAIPKMMGRPVSGAPEAELWMGAHPLAPSTITVLGTRVTLGEYASRAPERVLGHRVVGSFGPRLPFLLKVLAAAAPLSLQVHPTLAQARAGFAKENERAIPKDAPHRNYKDDNHKPELLCALEPFEALSGFRAAAESIELFEALAIDPIAAEVAAFASSPNEAGLRAFFIALMTLEPERRAATFARAIERASAYEGPFVASARWAVRLGEAYPGDIGAVSSLLLNLIVLDAGQAIYLPAGNLHAYLRGTGVEIMASSDNVLRGGLTPKHVDTNELLAVLDFRNGPVELVPVRVDGAIARYETPAREFELVRSNVAKGAVVSLPASGGPEILLLTDGRVTVTSDGVSAELASGESLFFDASDGDRTIAGEGTVFSARVPG